MKESIKIVIDKRLKRNPPLCRFSYKFKDVDGKIKTRNVSSRLSSVFEYITRFSTYKYEVSDIRLYVPVGYRGVAEQRIR